MSYGQINAITDPALRQLLQGLCDQISALTARVAALESDALQRNNGVITASARLAAVSDPVNSSDAVTVQYMRRYVAGQLGAFTQPPP